MDFVREGHAALDAGTGSAEDRAHALETFDRVAGVLQVVGASRAVPAASVAMAHPRAPGVAAGQAGAPLGPPAPGEDLDSWAATLAEARRAARMAKDWPRADLARKLLAEQGYEIRDNPDGSPLLLRKRPSSTT
jgi:cysteinyl-tRNA synthetase